MKNCMQENSAAENDQGVTLVKTGGRTSKTHVCRKTPPKRKLKY